MSLVLILIAAALAATSGVPALCLGGTRSAGQRMAVAMMAGAGLLGLAGAGTALLESPAQTRAVPPGLMNGGGMLAVDALGAIFLVPVFLVGALGSVYGLGYWPQPRHPANGRRLQLFWGLLVAGMATTVVARHAMLFLLGWEVMALAAFLVISAEDDLAAVRGAGWHYLVATHVGTLCLFAMFSLLHRATGSFDLRPVAVDQAGLGLLTSIGCCALLGFGLKAGLMPLHFWLPGAHANAPSHVSALMSGVVIKMGVYGLVRISGLLPDPPVAWGAILLVLGGISGVLGVVFAIGQHDLKRLLAYHSVENIGIIVMGLGLAMVGRSVGRADWVVLGLAGCLLHVWNHGLFKSLLFLSAGSVVHAAHTRAIDQLGGLAKCMPWTAAMFLLGAVAICGLPPLNGFVSELLIYLGLLRSVETAGRPLWMAAAAVPVLAMIGALALACFVKVYGMVFLGTPRSPAAELAHESPPSMLAPMAVLAGCCLFLGLAPSVVAPAFDHAAAAWLGHPVDPAARLAALAPLAAIGRLGVGLLAAVAGGRALLLRRLRRGTPDTAGTWDCGYARPGARMQYTASSFAQILVDLFGWALRPRIHRPDIHRTFAEPARFESHVDDVVLDGHLLPAAAAVERWLGGFRWLQQGLTQQYVLYIFIMIVVLMASAMPLGPMITGWFAR